MKNNSKKVVLKVLGILTLALVFITLIDVRNFFLTKTLIPFLNVDIVTVFGGLIAAYFAFIAIDDWKTLKSLFICVTPFVFGTIALGITLIITPINSNNEFIHCVIFGITAAIFVHKTETIINIIAKFINV